MYELENLKSYYKKKLALDIKKLRIGRGITGFVGPNGCGKSTLLRVLAFLQPFEGVLKFDENPNPTQAEKQSVTLLLQHPFLLKRSVFENIAFGLRIRKFSEDEINLRVHNALSSVKLSQSFATRAWFALSGGEAQRVALAARLALNPKVLLLDEPTSSIDKASAEAITDALRILSENGTAIIAASHDQKWLASIASENIELESVNQNDNFY